MKQIFKTLLFVMTAVMLTGLATSCSKDDEPNGGGKNADVVGTWDGLDYDHFYRNVHITFNSDGTGSATLEHEGSYSSYYRAEFTYKVKGKKVTTQGVMGNANSSGEAGTMDFNNTYEVKGNVLYVVSGNNWYTNAVQTYTNPNKPAISDDDDDEPSSIASNPMVGKTIRCKGNSDSAFSKTNYDYSIKFTSAIGFEQKIWWEYLVYDMATSQWKYDSGADLTHYGTYEYTDNKITLHYDSGGTSELIRQGNGWKDGYDLYY